jgi:hypothetical protein
MLLPGTDGDIEWQDGWLGVSRLPLLATLRGSSSPYVATVSGDVADVEASTSPGA